MLCKKKIIVLILLSLSLSYGCEDNSINPEEDNQTVSVVKISNEKADSLITDWIFTVYNPSMNPTYSIDSLVEYTTDEVFSKLKGQVFSVRSDVPGLQDRWIFIKEEKIYDLHGYHLDQYAVKSDSDNMIVTNLDGDSRYELLYTAMWGSFYMRTTVNCFYLTEENVPTGLGQDISISNYIDYSFKLEKENERKVYVRFINSKYDLRIGELKLEDNGESRYFGVILNSDVPPEIMEILLI